MSDLNVVNSLIDSLANQNKSSFDEIFIRALEFKGYEFKSREELNKFVVGNVSVEYKDGADIKTYYVKGEPFLLHDFEVDFKYDYKENTASASFGRYEIL